MGMMLDKDLAYVIMGDNVDLAQVKDLLNHGANPNGFKDEANYGETPFIYAAKKNRVDILEMFLEHGADINFTDNAGDTALATTVLMESKEAFEFLLLKGADVDMQNRGGGNPLLQAVDSNLEEYALRLLEEGANPMPLDDHDNTPLILAAFSGNQNIAKALLFYGANPLHKDCFEDTAWEVAKEQGHKDFMKLLTRWNKDSNSLLQEFLMAQKERTQTIKQQEQEKHGIVRQQRHKSFRNYISNNKLSK